jgi:hypothetical protein
VPCRKTALSVNERNRDISTTIRLQRRFGEAASGREQNHAP